MSGQDSSAQVVTFGETMALLRSEELAPLAIGDRFRLAVGGAESNVAIALRRLGVRVKWVGRVGDDHFGAAIERTLRGEGLVVVAHSDEAPTALMVKYPSAGGRTVVVYRRRGSAGSMLSVEDVVEEIAGARILHITGITPALSSNAAQAVLEAARSARARQITVSLDLNYRASLWSVPEARPVLRQLVRLADIVFADRAEAEVVTGDLAAADDDQTMRRLRHFGPSEIILKKGASGASALINESTYVKVAYPVHVVDTVGAGDAFVAGYLAEWLAGEPVQRRLDTAVAAGAFACTVPGDWEGAPSRRDLAAFMETEVVIR